MTHPEIEEILESLGPERPVPAAAVLQNAARILNYMDDINVERKSKFEYTAAESLYILWEVEGMEFHIECRNDDRIFYTFRKATFYKTFGSDQINQFIPRLESYLLAGMC
jgi:hypothetical protein